MAATREVGWFPKAITEAGHVEPAPRRVRGELGGRTVFDTTRAVYLWEWAYYPQYVVPAADFSPGTLVDEHHVSHLRGGTAHRHGLQAGGQSRPGAAHVFGEDAAEGLPGTVKVRWDALDAWWEEDERIFVHPRNPYVRVDALRSSRRVRVEAEGVLLAESAAPVLVFETGLPPRWYVDRSAVDFTHLRPSDTVTACPYKGVTSAYWSARAGDREFADIAWSYDFPTLALAPIAGLVAFFDEQVDVSVDGVRVERPITHFTS